MKTKLPSLVTILILTAITAVMWVSLGVYHSITIVQPASVPEEVSRDLTPTLDKATIEKIKAKIFINPADIPSTIITVSTPPPIATPIEGGIAP